MSLLMPFIMQKGQEREPIPVCVCLPGTQQKRITTREERSGLKEQHPLLLFFSFYYCFLRVVEAQKSCQSTLGRARPLSLSSTLTAASWRPLRLDDEAPLERRHTKRRKGKKKEIKRKTAGQNYLLQPNRAECPRRRAVVVMPSLSITHTHTQKRDDRSARVNIAVPPYDHANDFRFVMSRKA